MKTPAYWQHTTPLRCPKRHRMIWLGSTFWICEPCHVIYVEAHAAPSTPGTRQKAPGDAR